MNHIPTPQARLQPDTLDTLTAMEGAICRLETFLATTETMVYENDGLVLEMFLRCRQEVQEITECNNALYADYFNNK